MSTPGERAMKVSIAMWREQYARAEKAEAEVVRLGTLHMDSLARAVKAEADVVRHRERQVECLQIAEKEAGRAIAAEAEVERLTAWLAAHEAREAELIAALEAGDACGAVGCRALAERDALAAREARVIEALLQQARMDREAPYWQGEPHGETLDHVEVWLSSLADFGWSLRNVLAALDGDA